MDVTALREELLPELQDRWRALLGRFRELGSAVIAFSGGVDSGLLCAAAWRALGDRMLAVTVHSPVESMGDVASAQALVEQIGFPLRVLDFDDLADPDFVALVEGSNADDVDDYRPGRRAVVEIGAASPLEELGLGKTEIRDLARGLGLRTWDRPSAPCLATRFPYGSPITHAGLRQIADGERYLHGLGFETVRVRHHGQVARIEVAPDGIERLASQRGPVAAHFASLGFRYVAVDLVGYRTGSLNEVLEAAPRAEASR